MVGAALSVALQEKTKGIKVLQGVASAPESELVVVSCGEATSRDRLLKGAHFLNLHPEVFGHKLSADKLSAQA